jgi:nucleotide-binding universal stress UspA family protein
MRVLRSTPILNHVTAVLDSYSVRTHPLTIHATTAAAAILEAADNAEAQIIVIGTERRERRQRVSISRNVEQVLKRATCRVMIVTASPS